MINVPTFSSPPKKKKWNYKNLVVKLKIFRSVMLQYDLIHPELLCCKLEFPLTWYSGLGPVMVFSATYNNISVISRPDFLYILTQWYIISVNIRVHTYDFWSRSQILSKFVWNWTTIVHNKKYLVLLSIISGNTGFFLA